ncbi:hypothetical protein ACLB2K_025555 [Fragaria x ananassa]
MGEAIADTKQEKRVVHYSSKQKILLVGEGNFSFASCLAKGFGSAKNMVATSLDSRDCFVSLHADRITPSRITSPHLPRIASSHLTLQTNSPCFITLNPPCVSRLACLGSPLVFLVLPRLFTSYGSCFVLTCLLRALLCFTKLTSSRFTCFVLLSFSHAPRFPPITHLAHLTLYPPSSSSCLVYLLCVISLFRIISHHLRSTRPALHYPVAPRIILSYLYYCAASLPHLTPLRFDSPHLTRLPSH